MKERFKIAILLYAILALVFWRSVRAEVKINEIHPAPNGETEWVEFYNDSSSSANLSNYFFDDDTSFDSDSGSSSKIALSGILLPQMDCFLELSNYLNNSGDVPSLFYIDGTLVDSYSYTKATVGKSYSRIPDGGEWQIDQPPTKSSNRCADLAPTPTPTPTLTPTPTGDQQPTPTPSPTISESPATPTPAGSISPSPEPISYNNVYLSEAMVYPETGEDEWVEIYNDNDYVVSLANWYLDDIEKAGSSMKKFSLEIPPKGYQVVELTSSMFNNDGDSVRLLDFNQSVKDSFEYQTGEKGKTWARINFSSDQYCLTNPTKGSANASCLNPTPTSTVVGQNSPEPTKKVSKNLSQKEKITKTDGRPKPVYQFITSSRNLVEKQGQVLGVKNQPTTGWSRKTSGKLTAYVKGFSSSSFLISFLNIFYLVDKIIKKLTKRR